jgi:hypothetical protein
MKPTRGASVNGIACELAMPPVASGGGVSTIRRAAVLGCCPEPVRSRQTTPTLRLRGDASSLLLTAVMASSLRGGTGPGLLATALSGCAILGATHFLAAAFAIPRVNLGDEVVRLIIFLSVASGISALAELGDAPSGNGTSCWSVSGRRGSRPRTRAGQRTACWQGCRTNFGIPSQPSRMGEPATRQRPRRTHASRMPGDRAKREDASSPHGRPARRRSVRCGEASAGRASPRPHSGDPGGARHRPPGGRGEAGPCAHRPGSGYRTRQRRP